MYKFTTDEILNLLQTNEPRYIFYKYNNNIKILDPKALIRIIYFWGGAGISQDILSRQWETYENYIRTYDNVIEIQNVESSQITRLMFANEEYANYTYLHLKDQIKYGYNQTGVISLNLLSILNKGLNGKLIVKVKSRINNSANAYLRLTTGYTIDMYMKTDGYYLLDDLADFIAILNWDIFSMQNGVESKSMTIKGLINEAIKTGRTLDDIILLEDDYVTIYYSDSNIPDNTRTYTINIHTSQREYDVYVRNTLIGIMNTITVKGSMN